MDGKPKFFVGQVVHHRLFHYDGVIVGVDPRFAGTDEWYETVAKSRPPKDQPWYNVLVDQGTHATYVAERNLEKSSTPAEIRHPLVDEFFDRFEEGRYVRDMH